MLIKTTCRLLSTTALILGVLTAPLYSMQQDLQTQVTTLFGPNSPLKGGIRKKSINTAYTQLEQKKLNHDPIAEEVLNEYSDTSDDGKEEALKEYYKALNPRKKGTTSPTAAHGASNGIPGNLASMSISDLKVIYHNAIGLNKERDSSQHSWTSDQYVNEIIRLQVELARKGTHLFGGGASSSSSSSSSSTKMGLVTQPSEIEIVVDNCVKGLKKYLEDIDPISVKIAFDKYVQPVLALSKDWKNFSELYEVALTAIQTDGFSQEKRQRIEAFVNLFEYNGEFKSMKFLEKYRANIPDPFEELYHVGEEIHKHQYSNKYDSLSIEENPLKILCYIDLKTVTALAAKETSDIIYHYPNYSQLIATLYYFKTKGVIPSKDGESPSPAQVILKQIVSILREFTIPMNVTQKRILDNPDYKKSYEEFPKDLTKRQIIADPKHSLENFNVLMNLNIQDIKDIPQQTLSNIFAHANQLPAAQAKALLYHLANINFFTDEKVYKPGRYYRLLTIVVKDKIMPPQEKSVFLKTMNKFLPKDMNVIQSEIIANADYKKSYDEFPKDPTKLEIMPAASNVLDNYKVLLNLNIEQIRKLPTSTIERIFNTNSLTASEAKAILYYLASIKFFSDDYVISPGKYYILLKEATVQHVETAEEKRLKDENYKKYLERKERKEKEDQKASKERIAEERKQRSAEIKAQRAAGNNPPAAQAASSGASMPPPPPPAVGGAQANAPVAVTVPMQNLDPNSKGAKIAGALEKRGVGKAIANEVGSAINKQKEPQLTKMVSITINILQAHNKISKSINPVEILQRQTEYKELITEALAPK